MTEPEDPTLVSDLIAALEASLEKAKAERGQKTSAPSMCRFCGTELQQGVQCAARNTCAVKLRAERDRLQGLLVESHRMILTLMGGLTACSMAIEGTESENHVDLGVLRDYDVEAMDLCHRLSPHTRDEMGSFHDSV